MSIKACLLIYDIPDRSGVRNPSSRLRRVGARINLSCWVVPEDMVPYHLLHEMASGGATWHVVKFDDSEAEKLIGMAADAILKDARDAVRRAERSMNSADDALEDGQAVPAYLKRVTQAGKRAAQTIADLRVAAANFGLPRDFLSMIEARDIASVLQQRSHQRAAAYARMAQEAAQRDQAMADAARDDTLPAGVLADFLEDDGVDVRDAREVFQEIA